MSTRGQIVLPKAVRERHGWKAGERFIVEDHPEGVLLKVAKTVAPTRIEDVAGCLGLPKRRATIKDISSVSREYVRKRWGYEYDDVD